MTLGREGLERVVDRLIELADEYHGEFHQLTFAGWFSNGCESIEVNGMTVWESECGFDPYLDENGDDVEDVDAVAVLVRYVLDQLAKLGQTCLDLHLDAGLPGAG